MPPEMAIILSFIGVCWAGLYEKQLFQDLGIFGDYVNLERPVFNESSSVPLSIHLE